MNDRRDNGRRRESRVKEWETLERIVERSVEIGRASLRLEIVIDQPILDNDRRGFKRVATKISMGDRFLRLNTKALISLLDILTEERSVLLEAIDKVHAENEEIEKERRPRDGEGRGRGRGRGRGGDMADEARAMIGKPGGGLGRFTKTPKRDRKREKRRERREKEGHGDDA
jgi:hypothetical protein